jgi:hypothetical protein
MGEDFAHPIQRDPPIRRQMAAGLTKDLVFMITATHHRATFVKPEGP